MEDERKEKQPSRFVKVQDVMSICDCSESHAYANQYEQNSQQQYSYWQSGNPKIAYRHSSTGTAVWWWRRSPYYGYYEVFCSTHTDGSNTTDIASWSAGVVAGFAA